MDAPKSDHIPQEAFDWYDEYAHGFHNDSTARYDEGIAELAWQRTIEFFNEKLK